MKIISFKESFQKHYQNVKHLDPDQDWHPVGPSDLGPKLFAKVISRQQKLPPLVCYASKMVKGKQILQC